MRSALESALPSPASLASPPSPRLVASIARWSVLGLLALAVSPAAQAAPMTFELEARMGKRIDRGPGTFNYPSGITVNPTTGEVYVNDLLFNRIQKFDANGAFITQWNRNQSLGIDVDPTTGNLWVAVWEGDQVVQYDPNGTLLVTYGTGRPGNGLGEVNTPHDVSVDFRNGDVYVLDSGNKRVVVLDKTGQRLREFPVKVDQAFGIALHPGGDFLVISDPGTRAVIKLDLNGKELARWAGQGSAPREFRWCRDVSVDAAGFIYVADTDNERGQKLDRDGNFVSFFQGPNDRVHGAFHPRAVEVNAKTGELYAAAAYANRIDRFDKELQFKGSFGGHEKDAGVLNTPRTLTVNPVNGDVYVGDWFDHRVRRFDATGRFIQAFDGWLDGQTDRNGGPFPATFAADPRSGMWVSKEDQFFPASLWFDSAGMLWTLREVMHYPDDPRLQADWVIRRLTADGKFVSGVGNPAFPQSAKMRGLVVDLDDGAIYVGNSDEDKVMRLKLDGSTVWSVGQKGAGPGQFNWPAGIALDKLRGRLYVADTNNERITLLGLDGTVQGTFGSKGEGPGQFELGQFTHLALDEHGNLYVADTGNGRVQVFDPDQKLLATLGQKGSGGTGKWTGFGAIAVSRGRLYVLDTNGYEVEVYKIGLPPTPPPPPRPGARRR